MSEVMDLVTARNWLRTIMERHGANVTGSGVGGEEADIDFELLGESFEVTLRRERAGERQQER